MGDLQAASIEASDTNKSDGEPSHKHLAQTGLTNVEVLERRKQFGENTLPAEKGTSAWVILLNQLKSPLVYIILAAAGVSLVVGELGDFWIIMAVVIIDTILGFV
jgi:magnesium-transporting ATPase (P-type)